MHFIVVSGHRIVFQIDHVIFFRHRADPVVFFFVVPRIPEHLIAAEGGPRRHRQADPVTLRAPFQFFEGLFNVFGSHSILGFKILVENADGLVGIILVAEIKGQIQKKTAVFSAGERDVDIVEFLKKKLQPALQSFIYILL